MKSGSSADGLLKKDIPLNGKLVTSDDGIFNGVNFTVLQNMRYTDNHPQGILGMTKVNTAPLSHPHIRSGIHFRKDQPQESHVLVQAYNNLNLDSTVYRNDTAIPNVGDFESTALHNDTSGAKRGYFAPAPGGSVVYCNSVESCIWGGDEMRIGDFINYDPNGTFKYDYTDVIRNTLQDAANSAILHGVTSGGIDTNTSLCLHLDNDVIDASTSSVKTVTNVSMTFDSVNYKFGGYSGAFDGATSYLHTPDHADFDFSGGIWTIDTWLRPTSVASDQCLYSQRSGANDWMRLYVTSAGAVTLKIKVGGVESAILSTPDGTITAGSWFHIEASENTGGVYRIFVNGQMKATTTSATSPANYTQIVYIGAHHNNVSPGDFLNGDLDEFRVSKTCRHTAPFEVPGTAYSSGGTAVYCYVGATRSLKGINPYVKTANGSVGTVSVDYWDGGAWVPVTGLVDGTVGMTVLGRGLITFDDTSAVAKQSVRDALMLYWYRLTLSASSGTVLYHMTVSDAMQPMVDVWDGIERKIDSFQLGDGTTYTDFTNAVYSDTFSSADPSTYVDVSGLATTSDIVIGFSDRVSAVHFFMAGASGNSTANTICTVQYWNGTAWTSVGPVLDGTANADNASLASTGIISWDPPGENLEFRRSLNQQNDVQLFYYRFTFSQTFSANVLIYYATALPAPKTIRPHKFPLAAMNRIFLCSDQSDMKNKAICSADSTSDVFNGDDSATFFFGDATELTSGCWLYSQYGTTLYNTLVFTKATETYIVVGNGPKDWSQYQVSPTIGCPAPQTMVSLSAPIEAYGGSSRTVAIWQGTEGIYLFDGKGFTPIHGDISDYWDRRKSYSINRAMIEESRGFYDQLNQEYHWIFASGNSSSVNKELVYDVRRKKWYEIVRGTGKQLRCGFPVVDTYGNKYCYGSIDTGYLERLDYSNDFDGEDIVCTITLGDIPLEDTWKSTAIRWIKLITSARSVTSNQIIMTHYGDTSSSPSTAFTMSPVKNGYRVTMPILSEQCNALGDNIFRRLSFTLTTNNEPYGFEPLMLAIKHLPKHEVSR